MTNRLRNSAKPTTTWLGGMACSPRAFLVSESTMTMRVKLVIIMSSAGATVSSVSATMIVMLWLGLLIVSPRLRLTEAVPAPGAAGVAGVAGVAAVGVGTGDGAAGAAAAGLLPRKKVTDTI